MSSVDRTEGEEQNERARLQGALMNATELLRRARRLAWVALGAAVTLVGVVSWQRGTINGYAELAAQEGEAHLVSDAKLSAAVKFSEGQGAALERCILNVATGVELLERLADSNDAINRRLDASAARGPGPRTAADRRRATAAPLTYCFDENADHVPCGEGTSLDGPHVDQLTWAPSTPLNLGTSARRWPAGTCERFWGSVGAGRTFARCWDASGCHGDCEPTITNTGHNGVE